LETREILIFNRPKFNSAALSRYGIYRGLRNQAIKSHDNDFNFLIKIANTFRRKFMPDQVCGYVLFRADIKSYASFKNNCASRENFINSACINSRRRLNFKISAATKSARIVRLVGYEL
jgi:hypothetical protein